jgi:hypothetical protein
MQTFLAIVSIGCLSLAGLGALLRVYVWLYDRWRENCVYDENDLGDE